MPGSSVARRRWEAEKRWDDEETVRSDLRGLADHVAELREKYGDRLYLLADDAACEWASARVAMEKHGHVVLRSVDQDVA